MIKRWFHGTLGKLAGFAYTLGIISVAASIALGSTSSVQASPLPHLTGDQGSCLNTGSPGWQKYDSSGGHTFNVGSGSIIVQASIKAGDQCYTATEDGIVTVDGQECYSFSGLGTNSVTISALASNSTCKDISHTEVISEAAPADTPANPPIQTPANTATSTPSSSSTPSDTPDPSVSPTVTNTPTNTPTDQPTSTPTETAEPPNLVDPKDDTLIQDNDGNGVPSPGDVLQYTMTITNTGGSAAEGVVFNDTPDDHTSLVVGSVTTSKGAVVTGNSAGDNSVQVNIGTVEPAEVITITFNVTIIIGIPSDVTSVSNQGVLTGANIPEQVTNDPDTNENDDPTDTPIVHPTSQPTNTPSDPGEPTPEPQQPAPEPQQSEPEQPQPSGSTTTVLIPVTGVDRSVSVPGAGGPAKSDIFLNLGLGLLGVGMILQGLGRRQEKNS